MILKVASFTSPEPTGAKYKTSEEKKCTDKKRKLKLMALRLVGLNFSRRRDYELRSSFFGIGKNKSYPEHFKETWL